MCICTISPKECSATNHQCICEKIYCNDGYSTVFDGQLQRQINDNPTLLQDIKCKAHTDRHICICSIRIGDKSSYGFGYSYPAFSLYKMCKSTKHFCICGIPMDADYTCRDYRSQHICICKTCSPSICIKIGSHDCICDKDQSLCRSKDSKHDCICHIDSGRCKSIPVRHTCLCNTYPDKCITTNHICLCKTCPDKCVATYHQCLCKIDPTMCKKTAEHVCICNSNNVKNCKAPEHKCSCRSDNTKCMSTDFHVCVCNIDATMCKAGTTDHDYIYVEGKLYRLAFVTFDKDDTRIHSYQPAVGTSREYVKIQFSK